MDCISLKNAITLIDDYVASQKNLIINDDIKNKISNACRRTHLITTHVYQFIRLYILNCYHNDLSIPFIDVNFIKMTFKVLSLTLSTL